MHHTTPSSPTIRDDGSLAGYHIFYPFPELHPPDEDCDMRHIWPGSQAREEWRHHIFPRISSLYLSFGSSFALHAPFWFFQTTWHGIECIDLKFHSASPYQHYPVFCNPARTCDRRGTPFRLLLHQSQAGRAGLYSKAASANRLSRSNRDKWYMKNRAVL